MTYLMRRLAFMLGVLVAVTFLAFSATNVIGDPLFNVVGFYASVDCDAVIAGEIEDVVGTIAGTGIGECERVIEAREKYHLDDSLPVRYAPLDRRNGPRRLRGFVREPDAGEHHPLPKGSPSRYCSWECPWS